MGDFERLNGLFLGLSCHAFGPGLVVLVLLGAASLGVGHRCFSCARRRPRDAGSLLSGATQKATARALRGEPAQGCKLDVGDAN